MSKYFVATFVVLMNGRKLMNIMTPSILQSERDLDILGIKTKIVGFKIDQLVTLLKLDKPL
jgi:hypothetical protein